jgi:hypothetical protein
MIQAARPDQRPDRDALASRFARRVTARLDEQSGRLPHDIGERLRVARDQAVQRARQVRLEAAPALMPVGGGAAALSAPGWWLRIASVMPLLLLLAGLVLIEQLHERAEIRAAAEVDAALLADDLPPAAYGDPGFVEFLKQAEP